MSQELEIHYHKLTVMGGASLDRAVFRAMIRFAPGPFGVIFTDTYMGRKGAEMAVEKFQKVFSSDKKENT